LKKRSLTLKYKENNNGIQASDVFVKIFWQLAHNLEDKNNKE